MYLSVNGINIFPVQQLVAARFKNNNYEVQRIIKTQVGSKIMT